MRRLLFACLAAAGAAACGEDGKDDWDPGRPRIDDLAFLEQAPGRPFDLVFRLAFRDDDGDLSRGKLDLFTGGEPRSSLALAEVFAHQVPPLQDRATEGALEVIVALDPVAAGTEVEVGFVLEDGAGARSNEPTMRLRAVGVSTQEGP